VNQDLLTGAELRLVDNTCHAVSAASGIAAAWTWSTDLGLGAVSVSAPNFSALNPAYHS
jgi:hypothetical protein